MASDGPMLRSHLVKLLSERRDNDVIAEVPLESGGYVRLWIRGVDYDAVCDVIVVRTEEFLDLPETEPTEVTNGG